MTRETVFLIICRLFSIITALTAIVCVVVNFISAIRAFCGHADVFDGIFRLLAVLLACFVVVAETEWAFVIQYWRVLEFWTGRGVLIIFVAVMTRAFPYTNGEAEWIVLLQSIASYVLMACGVVYLISGIFCMNCLRRNQEQTPVTREQVAMDLDALDRRREELQAQLLTHEQGQQYA